MRRWLLFIVLILSFRWPKEEAVLSEFAGDGYLLQSNEPRPFMILAGEDFSYLSKGELVFQGKLPNGLGNIQVIQSGNGLLHLYGNLSGNTDDHTQLTTAPTWRGGQQLILMILDSVNRRVINPEIILNNPVNNRVPILRGLNFFRTPVSRRPETEETLLQLRPRDVSTVLRMEAGKYYLSIDWVDGRFARNDVRQLYSLVLYMNGKLEFNREIAHFQENGGVLELVPKFFGDIETMPVLLRPGRNILEVHLQDPKGLSASYEFTIDGGPAQAESGQL